jgi:hypothetical protein
MSAQYNDYIQGYNAALDVVANKIETNEIPVEQRLTDIANEIRALKLDNS